MQIKKDGFVYRVAYGLMEEENRPTQVNLCPLSWKFIWMFFAGWILNFIMNILIVEALSYFVGFFFARRSTTMAEFNLTNNFTIPYAKWPTTKSGKRILPVWFVLVGFAAWLLYSKGRTATAATIKVAASLLFWKWVGGIIVCIAFVVLATGFFKSEAWCLLKAWCKAKKEKVCPIIEVVE